jgi:hypothetical protein
MNHKITHAMVGIVAAALLVAVVLFSLVVIIAERDAAAEAMTARTPVIPLISHPVNEQMADCIRCHIAGDGGMPASHTTYGANTCLTCHAEAPQTAFAEVESPAGEEPAAEPADAEAEPAPSAAGGAAPIPHPAAEPYTNCVACHAIGGNRGMPENHAGFTNAQCTNCHAGPSAEEAASEPATAGIGPLVPHEVGGQFVNCDTCHAFGMGRLSMPDNHEGFTRESCTNCHKAAN